MFKKETKAINNALFERRKNMTPIDQKAVK